MCVKLLFLCSSLQRAVLPHERLFVLCNSSNSEDPHQTRRHPVPLLGLCSAPASACTGRKKHNKLQSRPTEEFPQPLPLRGQIIINRRLNNSEPSEWMPGFGPFLGTCSERLPLRLHVCMFVCVQVMFACVCSGGASPGASEKRKPKNN